MVDGVDCIIAPWIGTGGSPPASSGMKSIELIGRTLILAPITAASSTIAPNRLARRCSGRIVETDVEVCQADLRPTDIGDPGPDCRTVYTPRGCHTYGNRIGQTS